MLSPGSALPRMIARPAGQQSLDHDLDSCDITIHLLLSSFGNLRCRISVCFPYDSMPLKGLINPSCWLEARLRFDSGSLLAFQAKRRLSLLGRKSLLLGQWVAIPKVVPNFRVGPLSPQAPACSIYIPNLGQLCALPLLGWIRLAQERHLQDCSTWLSSN